jgi:hypothetical protein
VGKVTLKINSDEALSDESLQKCNSDEALRLTKHAMPSNIIAAMKQ